MNKVTIIGRLTDKPELRQAGENKVTDFTVAVARSYKSDKTDFIRCTAWNKTAELITQYLAKGYPIAIEGTWQTDTYTNKDGVKIFTNVCNVERFEFVPQNPKNNVAEPGSTPAATIAASIGSPFDSRYI